MTEQEKKPAEPEQKETQPKEFVPWKDFLESYPLNSVQNVSGYYSRKSDSSAFNPFVREVPILRLHCTHCEGIRNFSGRWVHHGDFRESGVVEDFLKYTCRDCREGTKTFCILSQPIEEEGNGTAIKIGELPELHIEVPQSLKKLLGDEYPLFIKGLSCERHGLGVGAFTYYRRVVEAQKNHLIEEILRVAKKLNAPTDTQEKLKNATKEKQFSRSVDMISGAVPESLLVDSHNPMKLLHNALSIGVHAETDENCLKLAHSIRLVLADLSERIKLALKEHGELRSAVSELFNFSSKAKKKSKESQP